MSLQDTPQANRLHIALFGRRNSGKSSLINALTGQDTALVSPTPGTTTDPVSKAIELPGIGPCLFIDTPGFDDEGPLGEQRIDRTLKAAERTDLALLLCSPDMKEERCWLQRLRERHIPVILLLSKADLLTNPAEAARSIEAETRLHPLIISTYTGKGIEAIHQAIIGLLPEDFDAPTILGNRVKEGDVVLLVMPQEAQAPKGRLILPQVQTLRELLDRRCIVVSCTPDQLAPTLHTLVAEPRLIITDSQVFRTVYDLKPAGSQLTSFSILMAEYKGDIDYFTRSAAAIEGLKETSRILIAEACTHAPLSEDIGRVKLPRMLRKKVGQGLAIDIVSGTDFPTDLTPYALIIHCGGCMFNRRHVLGRVEQARRQGIPMTNYGVAIAHLNGILNQINITPN